MKISEVGFRVVYKSFAVFPIGDFEESVKDYLGVEDANCMLTYGYIDVGRILRTFKIKKNVEVTDNGKIII